MPNCHHRQITESKNRIECAGSPAHVSMQSAWLARGLVLAHGQHSHLTSPCPGAPTACIPRNIHLLGDQACSECIILQQASHVMRPRQSCSNAGLSRMIAADQHAAEYEGQLSVLSDDGRPRLHRRCQPHTHQSRCFISIITIPSARSWMICQLRWPHWTTPVLQDASKGLSDVKRRVAFLDRVYSIHSSVEDEVSCWNSVKPCLTADVVLNTSSIYRDCMLTRHHPTRLLIFAGGISCSGSEGQKCHTCILCRA